MKIPAVLPSLLALLLALAPAARTHAQDAPPPPPAGASFDLFYNNLADDGDWYNTPGYGYVWHPYVADQNNAWRPYTDGYWAQTDDGWTWVSYESFGWATYHYGRWTRLNDLGWAWVPGYDWGPGWVSWRTNNDYVGWAPLPPAQESVGYQASFGGPGGGVSLDYDTVEPVSDGYTPAVDANFDIGPQNYCFVACANFGAPVLTAVLLPPQQNVVILQNTVNVTNIYYSNQGGQTVVYNRGGPDYNYISTRVSQPIQRLQIQSNTNVSYLTGNHPAGFNPTQVRNGVLQVPAPVIARAPVNFQQVKPTRVKATLAKPEVVHGWSGAAADPATVQRVREQIKQQAQVVPKRQPNGNIPMPARPSSSAPVAETRERQPVAAAPTPAARNAAAPTPAARNAAAPTPAARNAAAPTPAARNPAVDNNTLRPPQPAAENPPRRDQQRPTVPATPVPTAAARDRVARPAEPFAPAQPAARPEAPREEARPTAPAVREEQQRAPAPREEQPRTPEPRAAQPAERPEVEREARPTPAPREEQRAAPAPREEQRAAPAPREEQRAAPAPREEQRAAPAPREEQRAAPAPREEQRAAPAPREEQRATPAPRPPAERAPEPKPTVARDDRQAKFDAAKRDEDAKKKKEQPPQ